MKKYEKNKSKNRKYSLNKWKSFNNLFKKNELKRIYN